MYIYGAKVYFFSQTHRFFVVKMSILCLFLLFFKSLGPLNSLFFSALTYIK